MTAAIVVVVVLALTGTAVAVACAMPGILRARRAVVEARKTRDHWSHPGI